MVTIVGDIILSLALRVAGVAQAAASDISNNNHIHAHYIILPNGISPAYLDVAWLGCHSNGVILFLRWHLLYNALLGDAAVIKATARAAAILLACLTQLSAFYVGVLCDHRLSMYHSSSVNSS